MKTVCLYVLLAGLIAVGGCASGESYGKSGFDFGKLDKVAILEVSGAVGSEAAKNQIGDFFAMELLRKGYGPVERSQVQALLKEQKFQTTGITSTEEAVRAGKILNVPAVVLVNIPNYGEELSMTAKLVNVEDGSILWIGSGSGRTGRTLSTIFGAAAGAGAGAAAGGKDNRLLGGIAGGVLGGVAGQALTPQQAEQTQKVIKKICVSLPSRLPTR